MAGGLPERNPCQLQLIAGMLHVTLHFAHNPPNCCTVTECCKEQPAHCVFACVCSCPLCWRAQNLLATVTWLLAVTVVVTFAAPSAFWDHALVAIARLDLQARKFPHKWRITDPLISQVFHMSLYTEGKANSCFVTGTCNHMVASGAAAARDLYNSNIKVPWLAQKTTGRPISKVPLLIW